MPTTPRDDLTVLLIPVPASTARRLEQAASRRRISVPDFARAAIERALVDAPAEDAAPAREVGYRWKNVFLPDGTVLSFTHRGTPLLATVAGSELLYGGKAVSPSEFVNGISGATRNAWRDLWVRRPSDAGWIAAQDLRNAATEADLAEQIGTAGSAAAPAAASPVPGAVAGGARAATALTGLLGRRRRFGDLPVSARMGPRYFRACRAVLGIFGSRAAGGEDLEPISEAKGMFNRVIRHDRHDWQHVRQVLGMPDRDVCIGAVSWLSELRSLVKAGSPVEDHLARPAAPLVEDRLRNAAIELEKLGFDAAEIGPRGDSGDRAAEDSGRR